MNDYTNAICGVCLFFFEGRGVRVRVRVRIGLSEREG